MSNVNTEFTVYPSPFTGPEIDERLKNVPILQNNVKTLQSQLNISSSDMLSLSTKISDQNNKISNLQTSLTNVYTKSESNTNTTDLINKTAQNYYNKSEITQLLGDIQANELTQEQINQIIVALPDTDIVSESELNSAINSALFESRQYTDTQITSLQIQLNTLISSVDADLESHKGTDRFRWQNVYESEKESIVRDANNTGLKENISAIVIIPSPTEPMTVNDEAGGVIGITLRNTDTTICTVTINGVSVYNSDGLTVGIPIIKYFWLKPGDTLISTNTEQYEYTPFMADSNSAMYLLRKQLEQTQTELSNLKAGVEGKVLDTDNIIDIEVLQPYTISESLGGVVKYTGVNVLLTTWALEVNGTAVRNGSLLGLGTEQGEYAVNNNDVITSIGMSVLTFIPYKLGS